MPKWTLNPVVDGGDIVCRDVKGTRFGGSDDKEDNGIGAFGFPVRLKPSALLVSLPVRNPRIPSLADSPLPNLRGLTKDITGIVCVRVHSRKTGKTVDTLLADIGPSGGLDRGIDMSNAVVKALGLDLADGVYDVDYRIFGAGPLLAALQAADNG